MARKNIFQLVEESYSIQDEIRKINKLLNTQKYFVETYIDYTLPELLEKYLFDDWKYRDTCISIEEYFRRANACVLSLGTVSEKQIINNLEVIENFLKLFFDHGDELYAKHTVQYYPDLVSVFCDLIDIMEKRMGLCKREYKDKVILYPKNAPLEKVIDLCDDEDVQWELIRYVREELSLAEKRKSLAYLATNLGIEEDDKEKDEHIKTLVKKAGNVLNNLHIRHNNKTGKWENQALKELDETDAVALCDMVYNEMLTIILLREHTEYDEAYADFNKRQKEAKAKKKSEAV